MKGSSSPLSLEQFLGVKLFAWIGGLALFLGILFFVKYAFEQNLISPATRITAGFLAGVGLVVAGLLVQRKAAYVVLAQTLTATGIVVLYGVTYAAHALYAFPAFGSMATFGYLTVITAVAFTLAVRLEAQVIAVLGMVGGFLTPVVVSTGVDNPLGLFGYVTLLDVGLIAVARKRGWSYLIACAAGGTVLMQMGWYARFFGAGNYAEGVRVWVPIGIHLFFPALFALATYLQTRTQREALQPALGGLMLAGWGLLVAFLFLGAPAIVARPWILHGYLFGLNALLLVQVWLQPRLALAQWGAAVASFLHLSIWSAFHLTETTLGTGLVSYLIFGVMHTGFALEAMRRHAETMRAQRHGVWLGPVAVALVMIPIFTLAEVPWMIWPTVLLLNLMTIAVAALTLSFAPVLLALVMTLVAVTVWLFRLPPDAGLFGFLFVLGGFAMLFAAAGALLSVRVRAAKQAVGGTQKLGGGMDWLTNFQSVLPIAAGAMPFVLLILATQRLNLVNPSPVFGLGMVLALFLLVMMRVAKLPLLGGVSLACMAALEYAWYVTRHDLTAPWMALGWALGIASVFAGYAFLWRKAFQNVTLPWVLSAVAWLVQFPIVYETCRRSFPVLDDWMGIIPALFAVPCLISLAVVQRMPAPAEMRVRHAQMAWFAGVGLFFITLIFPIQLERQWITVGWALEGMALCWLYRRIPHAGLRGVGLGLLLVTFGRLVLNPAVLTYAERSGAPVWNWFLYTYLMVAVCLGLAAVWLAPPRERVQGVDVRPVLWSLAGVLLFLLVNIEIADAFTPEGRRFIAFEFGGNFARDMTYSIAWALFALGLLLVGFWKDAKGARYAGIGLMGVTLLKLFFHDLAQIGSIYRIGALMVVAVIALGASFLYQRHYAKQKPPQS